MLNGITDSERRWTDRVAPYVLFAILVLALFVRTYHLDSLPAGLYPDEATNGTDALLANETGDYRLLYTNNYGREGLFINLQALAIKYFGNTIPVLKFWSVMFGTLAVLGVYLLAHELFARRIYAIVAAFLLATSYWAINFSRIGFRAIMVTFLLTFSFYFFFKGLRTSRLRDFLFAGLFLGVGIHTYVAFRLAPLIIIALLPALFLTYERFFQRYWKHALAFALGAFITAAPMFYDFYLHPEHFSSRTGAVSIFSPEINKGDFWGTFGKTFGLSLVKYNFWGDQNWRHNYPPYPVLDPVSGALFLAGFLYIIWETIRLIGLRFQEKLRDNRLVRNWFLISAFFVMLMPEFLTEEGLPHALRAIGTQMPVYLIALIPLVWIINRGRQALIGSRIALYSIIAFGLVFGATFNLAKYFVFFDRNPNQHGAFNQNFRNMAMYAMSLPPTTMKYIVPNGGGRMMEDGLPVSAQPIKFLTYGKIENLVYLEPETTIRTRDSVIILMNHDDRIIERVRKLSPQVRIEQIDLYPGTASAFTIMRFPS
ncbi:MAG: glycosyltransferase family 39 protein [Candidatus Moraniibacteriota bacterium]|nr:MAG: glycosyltransferase family 39 protein [Candidatus Moranbacteria bacterium]